MYTEKEEVFPIDTENALILKVCQTEGIELFDYKRINDFVLPYVLVIGASTNKANYVKIHDAYLELINPWDISLVFTQESIKDAVDFFTNDCEVMSTLLFDTPDSILDSDMASLVDSEIARKNKDFKIQFMIYKNSIYKQSQIPITLRKWLKDRLLNSERDKNYSEEKAKLTYKELESKYAFTLEDLSYVSERFKENKVNTLEIALENVVNTLDTDARKRAYIFALKDILSLYSYNVDMRHWYKGVRMPELEVKTVIKPLKRV